MGAPQPITGQSLEVGGAGTLGWLSSIRALLASIRTTLRGDLGFHYDLDGTEESSAHVLATTPYTPLSPRIAIPDTTRIILVTTGASAVRVRLNGDPGGALTSTRGAGRSIGATRTVTLIPAPGTGRTLGVTSAGADATCTVDFLP